MCQLTSLSAFAQPSCCAAHDVATGEPDCHESVVCPMHGATSAAPAEGEQCPMHAGGSESDADCVMRSTCNGPAVALGALLTVPGVLPGTVAVSIVPVVSAIDSVGYVVPGHPVTHDTPPPRL